MIVRELESPPAVDVIAGELAARHAVVVRGGASAWPASGKHTLRFFADHCGDAEVRVRGGRYGYKVFGLARLRDFIDFVEAKSPVIAGTEAIHRAVKSHRAAERIRVYAVYSSLSQRYPWLVDDLRLSDFVPPGSWVQSPTWWIGGEGCETPFHWDLAANVFAQIVGTKVFELCPNTRDVNARMRPSTFFEPGSVYSSVNFGSIPDRSAVMPELTAVTLNAGDVIILPPRAWHQVTSVSPSISVQAFFASKLDLGVHLGNLAVQCKTLLHLAGLYRVGECVCHSAPEPAAGPRLPLPYRLAARLGDLRLHGRELADVAGWYGT